MDPPLRKCTLRSKISIISRSSRKLKVFFSEEKSSPHVYVEQNRGDQWKNLETIRRLQSQELTDHLLYITEQNQKKQRKPEEINLMNPLLLVCGNPSNRRSLNL